MRSTGKAFLAQGYLRWKAYRPLEGGWRGGCPTCFTGVSTIEGFPSLLQLLRNIDIVEIKKQATDFTTCPCEIGCVVLLCVVYL